MTTFTEADVEQAALDWLSGLGWQVATALTSLPTHPMPSVPTTGEVVVERRLRDMD